MASHVINMRIIGGSFGTEEMSKIWDETNRLQKQLDVEKALAQAEAELGIIPEQAAQDISRVADSRLYSKVFDAIHVPGKKHTSAYMHKIYTGY